MLEIDKIEIWSRGKTRDEFGNPYRAWIARIHFQHSFKSFDTMTLSRSMEYGDCDEQDCVKAVCEAIEEVFNIFIRPSDKRIVRRHYRRVYRDEDLDPSKWRLSSLQF